MQITVAGPTTYPTSVTPTVTYSGKVIEESPDASLKYKETAVTTFKVEGA